VDVVRHRRNDDGIADHLRTRFRLGRLMLVGAGVRVCGGPFRSSGNAGIHSTNRASWTKPGSLFNFAAGEAAIANVTNRMALPNGYRHPGSWMMPRKPGGLSSHNILVGEGTLTSAGAMGVNGEALLTGSGELTATGALVVSAAAAIAGSSSVSASVVAVLNAIATLGGSGALTAAMIADGYALAALSGSGTMTIESYATGTLAAAITPFTTLSPESLSAAVWEATRTDTPGTMGEALTLAHAILRNRTVTDPVAGTFTVYDDNDVVLLTGDLWADAAGATPYDGNGAERRDRLE
jgi:hypothetical protein